MAVGLIGIHGGLMAVISAAPCSASMIGCIWFEESLSIVAKGAVSIVLPDSVALDLALR